ncbi:hypothetical protein HYX10_05040 [Candidatus Woesearchaeota archaeon]|nr:hypothetical protein [Candidatus Woesearchaeota archaeon]
MVRYASLALTVFVILAVLYSFDSLSQTSVTGYASGDVCPEARNDGWKWRCGGVRYQTYDSCVAGCGAQGSAQQQSSAGSAAGSDAQQDTTVIPGSPAAGSQLAGIRLEPVIQVLDATPKRDRYVVGDSVMLNVYVKNSGTKSTHEYPEGYRYIVKLYSGNSLLEEKTFFFGGLPRYLADENAQVTTISKGSNVNAFDTVWVADKQTLKAEVIIIKQDNDNDVSVATFKAEKGLEVLSEEEYGDFLAANVPDIQLVEVKLLPAPTSIPSTVTNFAYRIKNEGSADAVFSDKFFEASIKLLKGGSTICQVSEDRRLFTLKPGESKGFSTSLAAGSCVIDSRSASYSFVVELDRNNVYGKKTVAQSAADAVVACSPLGGRGTDAYCDLDGFYKSYKGGDAACSHNFECEENFCYNSKCIEKGIIQDNRACTFSLQCASDLCIKGVCVGGERKESIHALVPVFE